MSLDIPDAALRYWGVVTFMRENPGLYGMDNQRERAHHELCKHYGLEKSVTKRVTDHLDQYEDVFWMHDALLKLKSDYLKESENGKQD